MYNVSPRLRRDYEALLACVLRDAGVAATLETPSDLPTFWRRDDVVLTQTCGYPYLNFLHDAVTLLATPCFDFPGCDGSDYSSVIVARTRSGIRELEQARGHVAVLNERHSNSGMNVLRHTVAPLSRDGRFFGEVKFSGSHAGSMRMLRAGEADLAAIDCITYGYLRAETPEILCGTKVVQYTAASPGLPLVVSRSVPEELQRALRSALLAPGEALRQHMQAVRITRFEHRADYSRIAQLEAEAIAAGYPAVA